MISTLLVCIIIVSLEPPSNSIDIVRLLVSAPKKEGRDLIVTGMPLCSYEQYFYDRAAS